jgi:hypothetical protein
MNNGKVAMPRRSDFSNGKMQKTAQQKVTFLSQNGDWRKHNTTQKSKKLMAPIVYESATTSSVLLWLCTSSSHKQI